jgi:MFS family permease
MDDQRHFGGGRGVRGRFGRYQPVVGLLRALVPGRMVFASPLEPATSTAISNWFVRRRSFALALLGVTQGTGLAAMPLVAQQLITAWGWRSAWAFLGLYTVAVGIVPALLLMARRPEDMSLEPDPAPTCSGATAAVTPKRAEDHIAKADIRIIRERQFTLRQALHTRAFWVLAIFSASGFMVQAALDLATAHAQTRTIAGDPKPLSQYQSIRLQIAEMAMAVDAARLMMLWAAWYGDNHPEEAPFIMTAAKCFANEAAFTVANKALQVIGGAI